MKQQQKPKINWTALEEYITQTFHVSGRAALEWTKQHEPALWDQIAAGDGFAGAITLACRKFSRSEFLRKSKEGAARQAALDAATATATGGNR